MKSCASSTASSLLLAAAVAWLMDTRDELERIEHERPGESALDDVPAPPAADLLAGEELELEMRRRLGSAASAKPATCCSHAYGMPCLLRTLDSLKPPVL